MCAPASTACGIVTVLSCSTTRSIGTTASAPSGTAPPVAIPIASPAASGRSAGRPAAIRKPTGSVPGVSSARIAKPSIAELGNGGRSTAARASSARTRPDAAATGTCSDPSGRACASTASSAASSVSSSAILASTLTAVISVVIPVHDEERSVGPLLDELAATLDHLGEEWEVRVRGRRLDRRHVRRARPAPRRADERADRAAAPQLRQGGGARRRASRRRRATSS